MNCSIIIRAYNEASHLPRLLEGITHQTVKEVEVILVDSGSTDATASLAESFGARVIKIPADEFTFGRSLNLGIQAAKNDFVVIVSAHVSQSTPIGWNIFYIHLRSPITPLSMVNSAAHSTANSRNIKFSSSGFQKQT